MATHGKGLICMPMSEAFVRKLQFPQMVQNNTDNHETAFTVSIDHISTSTGISAAERSVTAMACVEESSLRSYSRPMVSISGSAARIRFMMAAVFRASEVPVMFSPPSKPAAAGSVTAEYTTGISVSSTAASMVAAVGVATATITSTPSATRSAPIWFRLLWSACALA